MKKKLLVIAALIFAALVNIVFYEKIHFSKDLS